MHDTEKGISPMVYADTFHFSEKKGEAKEQVYLKLELKEVQVTSYQMFQPDSDDDPFDGLAVDPTDPSAGRPGQAHVAISLGDDGLLLPAVQTDDAFDFTTKPTAVPAADDAEQSLQGSMGISPDAFDFTTKPTAPEPYMEFKLKEVMISGVIHNGDGGDGSIDALADGLLPAVQTGDVALPGLPMTGNGNPDSFDFQPQFTTDDGRALGDPVTFTYTVNNTSSAYEGTHALYQDVVIPSLDTGPAVATETLTIVHEGLL